jgi:hypothetical protein
LTLVRCLLDSFDRGVALCVRGQTGRALEPMLGTMRRAASIRCTCDDKRKRRQPMKRNPSRGIADAPGGKVERRGLIVGAGVAGVAAAAAHALRGAGVEAPVAAAAKAPPAADAGYQVTPHVLRYYETAKS